MCGFLFGVGMFFSRDGPDDGFSAAGKFTACQHDAMSAGTTFEADIGPEAGDLPFISAARMRFAHTDSIIYLQVRKHVI